MPVSRTTQDLGFHRSVNPKMLLRLGRASECATTQAAPNHGEIHGALGPVHVDRVISQKRRLVHQQGKGREHGAHQDRGEAGLHAGQDRNARRNGANPGRITQPRARTNGAQQLIENAGVLIRI